MAGGTGTDCGADSDIGEVGALKITQGEYTFEPGQRVMFSRDPRWAKAVDMLREKVGDGPLVLEMVASVKQSTLPFIDKCGVGHHQILTVRLVNGDVEIFSGALVVPYEEPNRKSLGCLLNILIFLGVGIVTFLLFNSNFEFSISKSVFAGLLISAFILWTLHLDFSDPDRDPNDAAYM